MRLTHLQPHVARTDSTTAAVYVPEGPYQLGHSKNRRPDLPQWKIALVGLDPLELLLIDNGRGQLRRQTDCRDRNPVVDLA